MAIKKKNMLSKAARGLIIGEFKRFKTIISKYYPECKEKKEILKSFDEIAARIEKSIC